MSKPRLPQPPKKWSAKARDFWNKSVSGFVLEDHHVELLRNACVSLDKADRAGAIVDHEGVTTLDRFGQKKEHPAVSIELAYRKSFLQFVRQLGLDIAAVDEGYTRPPRTSAAGPKRSSDNAS